MQILDSSLPPNLQINTYNQNQNQNIEKLMNSIWYAILIKGITVMLKFSTLKSSTN